MSGFGWRSRLVGDLVGGDGGVSSGVEGQKLCGCTAAAGLSTSVETAGVQALSNRISYGYAQWPAIYVISRRDEMNEPSLQYYKYLHT